MAVGPAFEALARAFVLACVGEPEDVKSALEAVRAAGVADADVDEALLLVVAYAGVPRAILAFTAWRALAPTPSDVPQVSDRRAAGDRTFDDVYRERSGRVRAELRGLHPELAEAIIEDAYGRILARTRLSVVDRELLAVAMLTALGAPRQAAAHTIAARRAGATEDDVRRVTAASCRPPGDSPPP